jgi:hypothetical protein
MTNEYLEIYSKWQYENVNLNKEINKKKNEYLYLDGLIQAKKVIVDEYLIKEKKSQNVQI